MQLFLYLDYKFRFLDSLRLSYVSLLDYRLFQTVDFIICSSILLMLTSQDFNTKKDLFSNTTQNNVTL